MSFEVCMICGQHHPRGMVDHRTLEGEWCAPIGPMSDEDLERVRSQNEKSFNISWRDAKWVIATAIANRRALRAIRRNT